ncbi:MAG: peptidase T [Elusimicrobiaceae bacterium]|nr:peptidase T [Elusimicrobiaceae bacterium]
MINFKKQVLETFTKYAEIESGSNPKSQTTPSTKTQVEFAKVLKADLEKLGLENIKLAPTCHLTAKLPANVKGKYPVIGFLAHMDTYPEGTVGRKVKVCLHPDYQGGELIINKELGVILKPEHSPALKKCVGHDIITSAGNTLLGTDDKAGIAIIMETLKYLISHPEIKHGDIRIAFTPDEEIARGPDNFDVPAFGADFAYTLDGECGDGIAYENFNAATVDIFIKGVLAHPGQAKGIMENPVRILADIISKWPEYKLAETTCGRQGFLTFTEAKADFSSATASAMVRSFEEEELNTMIKELEDIVSGIRKKYSGSKIEVKTTYTYKNMRPVIDKNPTAVKLAKEAFKECDLSTDGAPIRGGTDGARLTYMGLITPNLDAGYATPHGPFEWASLDQMSKIVNALVCLCKKALE